jgi:hypothetical protein
VKQPFATGTQRAATSQSVAPPPGRPQAAAGHGLSPRTWLVAILLTGLCGAWVCQAEILVVACQITESVPAIPGLAALFLLLGVNAGLSRLPARARAGWLRPFSRAELLVIFLFVTIATSMMGVGVMRFLLALMTAPFYFPVPDAGLTREALPHWLVPHNLEVIRRLYESDPSGRVPWHAWWVPMLAWTGFFLALWATMYCLSALYFRAWAEEERLAFPIALLPLELTRDAGAGLATLLRSPAMWAGFLLAAVYNGANILHAYFPSFPPIPKEVDLSQPFADAPWSALRPLTLYFRPELIGIGFLVATDVSFSVWAFYALVKAEAVLATMYGYPPGEMPYPQEQGIGAYLLLGGIFITVAVKRLAARRGHARRATAGERRAALGALLGMAAVVAFARAAGMALWAAALYIGVVLVVAVVYARIRGEVGVPLLWLFPFYMQKNVLLYSLGSAPFANSGASTLPAFALLTFLARGYFPAMIGYELESMEIRRRGGVGRTAMTAAVFGALVAGFAFGWYYHLVPYYHRGAQYLRGGIWGSGMAEQEYTWAGNWPHTPKLPDLERIWATGTGAVVAAVLVLLRQRWVGFPLHPLGFAMTCSYGDLIWGPFLLVWLLKTLVLRYGGMRLYRQAVPGFLGFALGHYAVAGIFWGLIGAFSGEAVQGYGVWFG